MKRITIVAIASWSAASFAAAAFAYMLAIPSVAQAETWRDTARTGIMPPMHARAAMHHESELVVVLPPTVITSHRHRPATQPVPVPEARKLGEMTCTQWRPLVQGDRSQQVRSCD